MEGGRTIDGLLSGLRVGAEFKNQKAIPSLAVRCDRGGFKEQLLEELELGLCQTKATYNGSELQGGLRSGSYR